MKVFVTGHKGYIGVHLVDLLKQAGHTVTGCDLGLFDGCSWEEIVPADRELVKDIRDVTLRDLAGQDCIMHLAAISNDPMGEVNAGATYAINRDASIRIADLAKKAGVPRYLFAASCSVYGAGEKLDLDENDPLNPLTAYAKSKIETEQAVSSLADNNFTPAYLRNATAYGHSPMLRVDLVVNNLLACAVATGEIRIMSDGFPWRPLIHCRDIARAFLAFMNAPKETIHNKAVNVGGNSENYQVRDVGDRVKMLIPSAKITYTGEIGADPRNYRVKFDLLNSLLPDFKLQYNLTSGMEELYRKFVENGFTNKDWDGDQFVRLRMLKKRLDLL
jgi:nucleoside-diphosphate-sugar epimerase